MDSLLSSHHLILFSQNTVLVYMVTAFCRPSTAAIALHLDSCVIFVCPRFIFLFANCFFLSWNVSLAFPQSKLQRRWNGFAVHSSFYSVRLLPYLHCPNLHKPVIFKLYFRRQVISFTTAKPLGTTGLVYYQAARTPNPSASIANWSFRMQIETIATARIPVKLHSSPSIRDSGAINEASMDT